MDEFIETRPSSKVYGLPPAGELTDMTEIYQGYSDTCAIRCQEIILRDFGQDISQEALIEEAKQLGIYSNGTAIEDVGKLLELHGVDVVQYPDANIYDLVNELHQGKRIIVAVDSGELWEDGVIENMEDSFLGDRPDHALIVAGIDTTDANNVKVVLTDPGTGHVAKSYPIEQFLDAWNDSENFMVVTENPAPKTALGMVNFNYDMGNMPVGDMSFTDWYAQNSGYLSTPYQLDMSTYADFLQKSNNEILSSNIDIETNYELGDVFDPNASEMLAELPSELLEVAADIASENVDADAIDDFDSAIFGAHQG